MQLGRTKATSSRPGPACLTRAFPALALILAAVGAPALAQQTGPAMASAPGPSPLQATAGLPGAEPASVAPPAPVGCASAEEVLFTDCPLTWHGITLYGTYDLGVGWVSHGLPENGNNYEGESLV